MNPFPKIAALALVLVSAGSVAAQTKVDSRYPAYQKVDGIAGTMKSVGSDTMNNLMTLWSEGFARHYPNVGVEVEGKGSGSAPVALIEGVATFGPMSRPMKQKEVDDFEKKFGYKPTAMRTSIDMLAVFVHRDNPIAKSGLTLAQVDAIFSQSRKGGLATDIRTWGDLGLKGEWASKAISIYGRNSASGTYGYFKEHALKNGDFKNTVKEQPGSSAVVQGVASDKYAIGYSGIGYKTADVLAVPLAVDGDSDFVPADAEHVSEYPLARFLLVYLNYKPLSQLDPLRAEFLRYVFSAEGQQDVIRGEYLPVSAEVAQQDLAKIGLKLVLREPKK
ncbi:MAG: PstS family phosphate ABC transporter substrate-binding protein [Planctomycetes bacterium]|nr:PstS family phosphate ABC transporter substrate-binding protein [Planctomycetota bacterium]